MGGAGLRVARSWVQPGNFQWLKLSSFVPYAFRVGRTYDDETDQIYLIEWRHAGRALPGVFVQSTHALLYVAAAFLVVSILASGSIWYTEKALNAALGTPSIISFR